MFMNYRRAPCRVSPTDMNSLFHIISIIFVLVQFEQVYSTIETDGTQTSMPNSDEVDLHQALPLRLLENDEYALPVNSNPSVEKFACPNETLQKNVSSKTSAALCMFPGENEKCSEQVTPQLIRQDSCADTGTLYSFQYKICLEAPVDQTTDLKPQIIEIYSVCYHANLKYTIYAKHKILTDTLMDPIPATQYEILLNSKSDDDFRKKPTDYEKEHMIPQMLVPNTDIDENFARGVNLHYLNIQWLHKRLNSCWNNINRIVWKHLKHSGLIDKTTIFTTTPASKWIKLLQTVEGESILIILYNLSEKDSLSDEQYLCPQSICDKANWKGIEGQNDPQNDIRVQCCEANDELVNSLQLSEAVQKVTGILKLEGGTEDDENRPLVH